MYGIEDKINSESHIALENGVDNFKFRFGEEDMETALESEKRTTERLFKSEDEGIKYRATCYFYERKKHEVYFSLNQIKKLYESIINRMPMKPSIESLLGEVVYEFNWEPISFPKEAFSKEKLKQFLRLEDFKSCFYTDSHYDIFKVNSFEYFNDGEKHQILSIPITNNRKALIAEKMQKLYIIASQFKKDYSIKEYDFRKPRFAKVLMANFNDFRSNAKDENSFQLDLNTALSRMR